MSIKDMELVAIVSNKDEAVDVIAEIIKEEMRNKKLEEKVASVKSAQVVDERGHVEISQGDVSAKRHILPKGMKHD
jgi:hypothetical protein